MLSSATMTIAAFAWAAGTLAQDLATCDGFRQPDWDHCATIAAKFESTAGTVSNDYPECALITGGNSLNCEILVCPQNAEVEVLWGEVRIGYSTVEAVCKSYDAGGEDVYDDRFTVQVYSNPDHEPALKAIASRHHARDFFAAKRQQDSDDGYTLLVTQSNVQKSGTEQAVTGRLPAGSSYTTTETDDVMTRVSASVEAGASFFEIFSASVTAETSYDQTSTSPVRLIINIDYKAGQDGIVYIYPLSTLYQGKYTPSGDYVDWYIPDTSATGTSNFDVRCLD